MRPTAIKLARIRAGIKQCELAQVTGLGVSTLSRLENGIGKPMLRTLQILSKTLNVTIEELAKDYEPEGVR